MLKQLKHKRLRADTNDLARSLMDVSTQLEGGTIALPTKAQVSLLMAEIGRKGGRIGGKRRLETMTARERQKVAQKAARARWGAERE